MILRRKKEEQGNTHYENSLRVGLEEEFHDLREKKKGNQRK